LSPAPRIAVIVPCFNDGATVVETVDSVRAQEPCELVVVDDGSTDEHTARVLDDLEADGVRVIHKENEGLSAARMTGLEATSAPYVFPLDSDDAVVPNSLGPLADVLDEKPDLAAAWGDVEAFGDFASYARKKHVSLDPWRITHFNGIPYAALFRREALEAVGGWQLRAGGYEDWDLWMSLAERGYRATYAPFAVLRYRIHGQRMWAEAVERHEEIFAQIRARHPMLFERRRENWRASQEPWRLKLLMPAVDAMRFLSARNRRRLHAIVYRPGAALGIAVRRLRH
jgi:glycosyltransferase involved in cell wall biosynthesis